MIFNQQSDSPPALTSVLNVHARLSVIVGLGRSRVLPVLCPVKPEGLGQNLPQIGPLASLCCVKLAINIPPPLVWNVLRMVYQEHLTY